jgi:hypothetical protein
MRQKTDSQMKNIGAVSERSKKIVYQKGVNQGQNTSQNAGFNIKMEGAHSRHKN